MRLSIIGCGRAGGTIAAALAATGQVQIGQVLNRTPESAQQAVSLLGNGTVATDFHVLEHADAWLIGTSDDEISNTAARLHQQGVVKAGDTVFHLSGRHGPQALGILSGAGAELAAVHPVRSMPALSIQVSDFSGTVCVAEGSPAALACLAPAFKAAAAEWREIHGLNRGLYHAALAIISNVTKGVIWKSQGWLEQAGLDEETAAAAAHSLLQITTDDVFRDGVKHSITGPIVRGDTSTVEAHLDALAHADPHDAEIYRVLARTVLDLANERGDLADTVLERFEVLLADPRGRPPETP